MKIPALDVRLWLALTGLCAAVACGDDDAPANMQGADASLPATAVDDAGSLPPTSTVDGALPPAVPGAARFALVTQIVPSGDQATSYVSITNTFSSAQPIALDGAQQVLGRALAAAVPQSGTLFVSTGGAPELTRFELTADDKLMRTGAISFQPQGVASIGEYAAQLQILSSTKAYYFDARTAKVVVWDPTALTVTATIDLPELAIADALLTFTSTLPIRRENQLIMPVGWRTSNNQRVVKQAAVIVVDTTTNTARVLRDERCGYVRDGVDAADGRIYLATEAWGSAVHRINPENAPAPCLLRLKNDLSGFDEGFHVELNKLGGGAVGSLVETVSGRALVRVLDEATAGVTPMTSARALASTAAWRWAELTLGDAPTLTPIASAPLGTGSLIVVDVPAHRYVAEIRNDRTDILDITDGVAGVAISTPGLTFSAVQLR
jgi:hypothetical protein